MFKSNDTRKCNLCSHIANYRFIWWLGEKSGAIGEYEGFICSKCKSKAENVLTKYEYKFEVERIHYIDMPEVMLFT